MDVEAILAVIGVYSLCLIVCGTIANALCIVICIQKSLRKTSTFTLYTFLLISDTMALFAWNLDHYLLKFHNYQLEDLGVHMCRFVTLWQLFAFQCSAWLLVTMTLDRYLSIKIKQWRLKFKMKYALVTVLIIFTVLLAVNMKFALTISYNTEGVFSKNITCFGAESYAEYMQQNNISYFILPFILMTIVNILLFCELNFKKKDTNEQIVTNKRSRRRATNCSVLLLSTLFMILTAPDAIANAFYVPYLFGTRDRIAILFFLDSIAFTFHSFNFVTLLTTNEQFVREIRSLFRKCIRSTRVEAFNRNLSNN